MCQFEECIAGWNELSGRAGFSPVFHQSRVRAIHLYCVDEDDSRRVTLDVAITFFAMSSRPGVEQALFECDPVNAVLRFEDVVNIEVSGFNHCNDLNRLEISEQTTPEIRSRHYMVTFVPGYGMASSFRCFSISVS